jgi:hypothetical protein
MYILESKCREKPTYTAEPEFLNFYESQESIQKGINSASLCSLAGRHDNPIPALFLAPINCLKIPAQYSTSLSPFLSYIDAHSF